MGRLCHRNDAWGRVAQRGETSRRVPTFRPDLDRIPTYDPGKPIDEVSRELGITDIVKLASNESPLGPFPAVEAVIAAATADLNRYPETTAFFLAEALAAHLGVDFDQVWVGPGSTSILTSVALATLPGGGSAIFADPSFVVYPMATALAGATPLPVPLDGDYRHDPGAMAAAVRDDTRVLFYCNPNNPTGTHSPLAAIEKLVAAVPDRVTIVIDEAYHEYVSADDYGTAIPLALERDNLIVSRTFSKVYGLAGLRVGYAVGNAATMRELKRPQAPFAVTSLAQVAAVEALRHQDEVAQRVVNNALGRDALVAGLRARRIDAIESQTNFVLYRPTGDAAAQAEALLQRGVIVRPMGPWIRVSVGTADENRRFLTTLDEVTP